MNVWNWRICYVVDYNLLQAVEDVDKCVKWSEGEDECCQLDACTTGILDAWPAVQVEDWLTVDASKLGDFPAKYTVPNVRKNEFLAVGIYVDPRIVPGFKYRAKPINPTAVSVFLCDGGSLGSRG